MKVAQHLQIEKAVHQRAIPSDIESDQTLYYSESKGVHIDILNMDLHHLIRVTKKLEKFGRFTLPPAAWTY